METPLKIAFATDDVRQVNQHFGSARTFAVYAVAPDNAKLLEAPEFGPFAHDGNEDQLAARIAALEGCAAVYCEAISPSAVPQLIVNGIQPVAVRRGSPIAELIDDIQNALENRQSIPMTTALVFAGTNRGLLADPACA